MSSTSVKNFMKQQGFTEEQASVCDGHFSGLSFQPKVLGMMIVIGLLLQSPIYFLVLSAVLWWNVAFKRWNLFELLYNRVVARPGGKELLGPAPPPRLFAQAMAATFFLLTGPRAAFWLGAGSLDFRGLCGDCNCGAALWKALHGFVHLPSVAWKDYLRECHAPLGSFRTLIAAERRMTADAVTTAAAGPAASAKHHINPR